MIVSDAIDEIEDYDYFDLRRKTHLAVIEKRRAAEFNRAREIKKVKSLSWTKDGNMVLSSLHTCLTNIKSVLIPHNNMKVCMAEHLSVSDCVKQKCLSKSFDTERTFSMLLLREIKPIVHKCTIKFYLILLRTAIMQSVRLHYILKHSLEENTYTTLPLAWRTFRILFRVFMRYVPVAKADSNELQKRRNKYRAAKKKLELIHSTMRACDFISECKSMQHTNPKGCSNCGVIYIGGSLSGDNRYVKSVGRDTGVPTLVTLDFEIETLKAEEIVQLELLRDVKIHLEEFENQLSAVVIVNLQRWWVIVLAWKRFQRRETRLVRSRYWYRIRRLAAMKKDLDIVILEAAPIDMVAMGEKYSGLGAELTEYVAVITERKRIRIAKWAEKFHRRLFRYVEQARHERYLASLKVKPVVIVEKPIVFRTVGPMDKRQFVCFRMECKLRRFLTEERYETHMAVHRREDVVRYKTYDRNSKAKTVRDEVEKQFLRRVADSRNHLQNEDCSHLVVCDYSVDGHYARIIPPIAEVAITTNTLPTGGYSNGGNKMSSLLTAGYDFNGRVGNSVLSVDKNDNNKEIPPLYLPTTHDHHENTITPAVPHWMSMAHLHSVSSMINSPLYTLEMVSKQADITVANTVRLDQSIVRIGTHGSCECVVKASGASVRENKVSKIHCMLYCSMTSIDDEQLEDKRSATITLVDNSSEWGTYVVSVKGTSKVHTRLTAGYVLTPGLLVCIGVCRDGPQSLSATEANEACVVYRVRCRELEG